MAIDPDSTHQSPASAPPADGHLAASIIRDKLARLYNDEPNANTEVQEADAIPAGQRSKHQQFMYQLGNSGKDLATIQTEWHNYYLSLPEHERHEVWHEFYASQAAMTRTSNAELASDSQTMAKHKQQVVRTKQHKARVQTAKLRDARSVKEVQATIRDKVSAGGTLNAKHHLQSLFFGLGMGGIVVIIFLFSFFNEVIIAPFIQPSRAAAATPLIVDSNTAATSSTPEVIIPKINVEIPVNYTETSTVESDIENDLEGGVVHYPSTVLPGQNGNAAFFGHSSNNIFNKGRYKFAFVLLHTMVPGDTFYLTYNHKVFVYKVISKTVVDPSDVGVLGPVPGQTATATLITCDPPGTSLRRLILVGQQISPDPTTNGQPAAATTTSTTKSTTVGNSLPGNGPTLWSRVVSTTAGKAVLIAILAVLLLGTIRWVNKPARELKKAHQL